MALSIFGFTISWPLVGALTAIIAGRELWNMTYFKRRGVKGPTPLPFVGNLLGMFTGAHFAIERYIDNYGTVFGIFFFSQPVVVVGDLDMIKDMTVKSFSKFMNHKQFVLKGRPFDKAITGLRDQHWKDVRNVITPTFSAVKMKQTSPLVNECCDTLVKNFGESQQKENKVNVFRLFEAFTMDGIAKCAFGIQVDSQNNPDEPFVTNAKKLIKISVFSPKIMIAAMFPTIGKVMDYFRVNIFPAGVRDFFISVVDQAISIRKRRGENNRKDFLQLILDAEEESKDETAEDTKEERDLHSLVDEHHDASYFDIKKSKKTTLTRDEIYGQAMLFFIAGYETTNLTLGFLAYSLATNPEVQNRLIEEIDEQTPTRDSVTYNTIANMPYLDNVVCETLRLYPAGAITERECNETYTYKGVTVVEKGIQVLFPVYSIHRDPQIWPDPSRFDPNRFTKENREGRHPFAWMPFGAGPRNCIGMRFALMEIKMAVVRLLQKYRFETSPDTEIPVKLGVKSLKPEKDIVLRVVERN